MFVLILPRVSGWLVELLTISGFLLLINFVLVLNFDYKIIYECVRQLVHRLELSSLFLRKNSSKTKLYSNLYEYVFRQKGKHLLICATRRIHCPLES